MKSFILLGAAVSVLLLGGCASSSPPPRPVVHSTSTVIIGEDDYDYYPGYEVYYSRAHNYYYYRDGSAWVRRNDPPRNWVRGSSSVRVHFSDAPDHHHTEIVRKYPRNWRAPDRDHDGHDARHDRDDHDRDRH
jgi:hypothetical protein